MKSTFKHTAIALILTSFAFIGCTKEETPTISDTVFYQDIAYALASCYSDIYNQELAGKPVGTKNITTTGPMGGTVVITGTTGQDATHDITTTDLVYTMTDVKYNTTYAFLTITGAATHKGSFSSTYTSVNHLASNLRVNGYVKRNGITRNIDQSGEVNINRTSKFNATVYGFTVSW